jgi:hypothetical protein
MKNLIILTALFTIAVSCSDVNDFTLSAEEQRAQSQSIASDNNLMIANAEEMMDITGKILSDANIIAHGRAFNGNRVTSGTACDPIIDHFYLIDLTHYDTILYIGVLTLDYGDGNTCNSNSVRKGKVIDDFIYILNTKKEIYSSKETITFENYQKDSQQVEGTFMITSNSQKPVTLNTSSARITYADGTFMTMQGELRFDSYSLDTENGESSIKKISGYMEGTSRESQAYTSTITTPIEYHYDCSGEDVPVPVTGTVLLNVNRNLTTVEYGNGSCDRVYTITSGGNSNTYPIPK